MAELTDQIGKHQAPEGTGILDGGRARAPTAEELANPVVAPGEPALLPIGIIYQANWQKLGVGIDRHARAQVRALSASGLPVALRTVATGRVAVDDDIEPEVLEEIGYLRSTSLSETAIAIRHTIIHNASQIHNLICPPGGRLAGFAAERAVYAATILYTSWERSTVDKQIVEILERCGQVWLPCERNAQVFISAGVPEEKVRVVPLPYDPGHHLPSQIPAPRGSRDVPEGKRFYAIGKWEPRKNYHLLIGAFLKAHFPTEKASLLIKTHGWGGWEGYPAPQESVAQWLADPSVKTLGWNAATFEKRVRILTKQLSDERMNKLHEQNNIYVSPSHGEAWELGAFDAVAAGNSIVHVGYGGSEDYAPPGSVRVPYRMMPVHDGYGWEPDAEWASCGDADLQEALRLAKPPERRVHPPYLYGRYGTYAVGEIMRKNVVSLARKLNKRTADALVGAGSFG
jgi:glycosyltransferase involved in cell wall biosynthesis